MTAVDSNGDRNISTVYHVFCPSTAAIHTRMLGENGMYTEHKNCKSYGLSDQPIYVFTLYSLKGLWGDYRRFPQPTHVNHN